MDSDSRRAPQAVSDTTVRFRLTGMGERSGSAGGLTAQIAAIAVLQDPVRFALFAYVAGQREPVGRERAATATGTRRELAAFHLDRLVDAGLLEASYRRLSGRTGPGAGRPAKLYRRTSRQLELTVPARHYALAAELFAAALDGRQGDDPKRGVRVGARRLGVSLGTRARAALGPRPGRARLFGAVTLALREGGYEPAEAPRGSITLDNCPFDALARDHRGLVCGMNLALIRGIVAGLGAEGLTATLEPRPGSCCVAIREHTP